MKLTEGSAVYRLKREKAEWKKKFKKISLSLWTLFLLKKAVVDETVEK